MLSTHSLQSSAWPESGRRQRFSVGVFSARIAMRAFLALLQLGCAVGLIRGLQTQSFLWRDKGLVSKEPLVKPLAVANPRGVGRRGAPKRLIKRFQGVELSVTNMLIGLNVLVFGATQLWPTLQTRFMKNNAMIFYGQSYRIFTSTLLHGSLQHLVMNMYSLSQVGPIVEQAFGAARFGAMYIGSGAVANVGTYLLGRSARSVGASGCLFGLIGALGLFFYRNKQILGPRADAGLESIKRTVVMNFMYSMMLPGIDNGAHFGGLLGGALLCLCFGPRLQVLSEGGRRLRVVDRPLVNYIPLWRRFLSGLEGNGDAKAGEAGTGTGTGTGTGGGSFRPRKSPLLD